MKYDQLISNLIERPRLQMAVVKMLPLDFILVLGVLIAPWDVSGAAGTSHVFAVTMAILATVCMVGWSLICIGELSSSPSRDLLTFTLFMVALAGMRHVSDAGQFLGYALLFLAAVLWMSIFSSAFAFALAWLESAAFLFVPLAIWPGAYTADKQGLVFIFAITTVSSWSMMAAIKTIRAQLSLSGTARLLHDAILEGAGECYVCVDEHGLVREYNSSAQEIFGRPASEVIGAPIVMLLTSPPKYPEKESMTLSEVVEGVRADGTRFPLQCFTGRVDLQDKTLHPLFMHDISTRQRRESLRAGQHEVTALISRNLPRKPMVQNALECIGKSASWDGMTLLVRQGLQYHVLALWTLEDADALLVESLKKVTSPVDAPYWQKLIHNGADWVDPKDVSVAPFDLFHQIGATCVASAMTADGQYLLQGWVEYGSALLRDELAKADYLSSLQLMVGQIGQYLARRNAETKLRSVQAMELNDDVVQALAISFLYRNQGDTELADQYAKKAFRAAQHFITQLALHDGDLAPGTLVREPTSENPSFEGRDSV